MPGVGLYLAYFKPGKPVRIFRYVYCRLVRDLILVLAVFDVSDINVVIIDGVSTVIFSVVIVLPAVDGKAKGTGKYNCG